MSRVQLALNVGNLEEAIGFYSEMFGCEPAKIRPGYANFAIDNPPLKLVLIEGRGTPGTMNHVGVEVESAEEVGEAITNAARHQRPHDVHESETCCYAVQDKVWVHGPELSWEWYTVLEDAPNDTSLQQKVVVPLTLGAKGNSCDVAGDSCC